MPPNLEKGGVGLWVGVFLSLTLAIWFFNDALFLWVNGANTLWLDTVLGLLGGLGDGLVVVIVVTALMLWNFRAGVAGLVAFLGSGLVAQALKHIFNLPRPAAEFADVHILGHPLMSHSFPSGHATSLGVVFFLALLVFGRHDWRAWFVGTLMLLAAISRVYGGVHFPLDVWAGFSIGIFCMWGAWLHLLRWPEQSWETSVWAWNVPALILIVEAAILGLGYRIQPSTAEPLVLFISVSALVWVAVGWRRRFES